MVKGIVGPHIKIKFSPTHDLRFYHISSEKIARELGFKPIGSVREAIKDLCSAFAAGKIPNPLEDIRCYNIKTMLVKKLK